MSCAPWEARRENHHGSGWLGGKNIPSGFSFSFMQEYSPGRFVEELKRGEIKGEMSLLPTQLQLPAWARKYPGSGSEGLASP